MGIDKHARYCTRFGRLRSGLYRLHSWRRLYRVYRMAWIASLLAAPLAAYAAELEQPAVTLPASAPAIAPLTDNDCSAMLAANVITPRNPLPCKRLARVRFSYVDFEGHQRQDGEMVVMDAVAPYVQHLLAQLLAAHFPLHGARDLAYYRGDDLASMADNNSSAFNGRPITGGGSWSKHAYGVAIDINPLQNPYASHDAAGRLTVLPPAAAALYAKRAPMRAGMAEAVRVLFAENGFLVWGGAWHEPVDYQHFEIGERAFVEKLAHAGPDQAARMFERYVRTYRNCVALRTPTGREAQCMQKTMRSVD
ncbi:MAG TPA: M15 family metallopeptidase [Herbaspirillum sp.]